MAEPEREGRLRLPRRFGRPWLHSDRPVVRQFVRPADLFFRTEVGSGSLLLAAALVALVWSNLATGAYGDFWTTQIKLEVGSFTIDEDLRHLVNDLLMAIFFYVVALEVKREFIFGSLREGATAAVPAGAALGTMVGAAAGYVAVNLSGGVLSGWAIPIATDIAFALAALGIAGRRAPPELRAFLLTLAVVDDLATIGVIAIFFGEDISLAWLGGGAAVIAGVLALQRLEVRLLAPYVLLAGLLWLAIFESGVHATIAGVLMGVLTPSRPFYPREEAGELIATQLGEISDDSDLDVGEATMSETSRLAHEAVSPLARLENALHPWSAYVVLPLFALANAGVVVTLAGLGDALGGQIGLGILVGLVIGAPLGGILVAWTLVRFTRVPLPEGLDWSAISAVAPLKGIGFTVAIFIAVLALDEPAQLEQAKLAILIASALSAAIGLLSLSLRHRRVEQRV
ncbi:MAG: Na+/H+ antiporter NhaA [Solirubrobacterales bacterium]